MFTVLRKNRQLPRFWGSVIENADTSRRAHTFFCILKTFSSPDDLGQLLQAFDLLVNEQFPVTHHIDEQQVRDLQRKIALSLRGRTLGAHPLRR